MQGPALKPSPERASQREGTRTHLKKKKNRQYSTKYHWKKTTLARGKVDVCGPWCENSQLLSTSTAHCASLSSSPWVTPESFPCAMCHVPSYSEVCMCYFRGLERALCLRIRLNFPSPKEACLRSQDKVGLSCHALMVTCGLSS